MISNTTFQSDLVICICCTFRSWYYKIVIHSRTVSPWLEDNNALKVQKPRKTNEHICPFVFLLFMTSPCDWRTTMYCNVVLLGFHAWGHKFCVWKIIGTVGTIETVGTTYIKVWVNTNKLDPHLWQKCYRAMKVLNAYNDNNQWFKW
jgi:hypothetical protein